MHWRTAVLLASAFATVLLASVATLLPVPFVVLHPGPAINTLGSEGGHPLISVTGHQQYPASGALDLTTVTVSGGPGRRLLLLSALQGWFDDSLAVYPEKVIYPPGKSVESSRQENQQEMVTSQESATVAALHELGITVPATLTVDGVDASGAGQQASPLRAQDVLLAVNGVDVVDLGTLTSVMAKVQPGATIPVKVRRGGTAVTVQAPTRRWTDGRTVLGIRVDPTFHPPFEVKIQIDNVGGPSAGAMFALGIVDLLTPGDLTGGQNIAGTGTIDPRGQIGPIGGIQQKLVGARDVGAHWFLAPAGNCDEVVGHVPSGLRVVKVSTLSQARAAVTTIASGTGVDALPACTR
jgi:PDZ domain-containing protein